MRLVKLDEIMDENGDIDFGYAYHLVNKGLDDPEPDPADIPVGGSIFCDDAPEPEEVEAIEFTGLADTPNKYYDVDGNVGLYKPPTEKLIMQKPLTPHEAFHSVTKKYIIHENCIQDDHPLAFPTRYKEHYVETDDIEAYILNNMTDCYGHPFEPAGADMQKIMDVDYTSHAGSIRVEEYHQPNFKK